MKLADFTNVRFYEKFRIRRDLDCAQPGLANPRPFSEPIPAKGALGLWRPDRLGPEAHAMLERELERVGVARNAA